MIPWDKGPYRFYCLEYINSHAREGETRAAPTILYILCTGWKRLARSVLNEALSKEEKEREGGTERSGVK